MNAVVDHQTLRAAELWSGVNIRKREESETLVEITDRQAGRGQTLNGTTAFFRLDESPVFETAVKIHERGQARVDITFLGGSVGAQAYSMAFLAQREGMDFIHINTLDLSLSFTRIAQAAVYPALMADVERRHKLGFLEPYGEGYVSVKPVFRDAVSVFENQSITALNPNVTGDIMVMTNVLGYMDEKRQANALKIAASRARHAVAFLGGSVATLPRALDEAGLVPLYGRAFDANDLCENFMSGCSTMAFKYNF